MSGNDWIWDEMNRLSFEGFKRGYDAWMHQLCAIRTECEQSIASDPTEPRDDHNYDIACPNCGSSDIHPLEMDHHNSLWYCHMCDTPFDPAEV